MDSSLHWPTKGVPAVDKGWTLFSSPAQSTASFRLSALGYSAHYRETYALEAQRPALFTNLLDDMTSVISQYKIKRKGRN